MRILAYGLHIWRAILQNSNSMVKLPAANILRSQIMPLAKEIQEICSRFESDVMEAVKATDPSSQWEEVVDEDGNPNVPSDERTVLVFQFGGQGDAKRPDDAPYGLAMGYFDHDRQYWRVHGSPSRYVTHWQNVPNDPPNSRSH